MQIPLGLKGINLVPKFQGLMLLFDEINFVWRLFYSHPAS